MATFPRGERLRCPLNQQSPRLVILKSSLTPEMRQQPENQRQGRAKQQAGDNWKIKRGVAALVDDVAGQPAQPKRQPARPRAQQQQCPYSDKHRAENQQTFAELAQQLHEAILFRFAPEGKRSLGAIL